MAPQEHTAMSGEDHWRPWPQTAGRAELNAYQINRLRAGLRSVLQSNRFYQRKLADYDLSALTDNDALRRLPFTIKSEWGDDQRTHPPYGTNLTFPLHDYIRLHQTSGTTGQPYKMLDTAESWEWWADCWATVLQAAGVTNDDVVFLAFSFGPFIGFWSAYEGAKRIGALVVPGGGQSSLQRLQTMLAVRATVLICTPTYALHLAEVAQQEGLDLADSPIRLTIHAGEPGASLPGVRRRIETAWGARVYDHAGMTEVGAYGFTCLHQDALHINEGEFIAEILDPQTNEPVQEGQRGELILTSLGRWGSPAIRLRTRDLVQRGPTTCPCGRTYLTLPGGILGRVDDMLIIRGVNVYPSSIEDILRRFPEAQEFRIIVLKDGSLDEVALEVECPEPLVPQIEAEVRRTLSLRVPVQAVAPGSLPRFELKARRIIDRRAESVE